MIKYNIQENAVLILEDGTIFKGKHITVREYVIRSERNDPRNKHPVKIEFKEQRASDRRRGEKKNIHVTHR